MKNMTALICLLACATMLTGCNGGKDLEGRDFVMAVGVEEEQNNFILYTSVAKLSSKGEDTGTEEILYEGRGYDIASAFEDMNSKTAGEIYMGHTKALVLDSGFTRYGELMDYIKDNVEMGRDVVVVKSDNVKEIMSAKPNDMTISSYIYKFFEDKDKTDIDDLIDSYNYGSAPDIPKAQIKNESIEFI